jgi:hypothetical protein
MKNETAEIRGRRWSDDDLATVCWTARRSAVFQMMLSEWAELSTVVTALVAVLALVGAIYQVRASRENQREATASALYAEYLSLAIQYPKFAGACIQASREGEWTEEFESYKWFVSLMLHACEQIVDLTQGDKGWEATIKAQLTYHRDHLLSASFRRDYYSKELVALFPGTHTPAL